MMSREYFLDDSEPKYKDAYLKYMIAIAELLGANKTHATSEMTAVLDFEVQLANVSTRRISFQQRSTSHSRLKPSTLCVARGHVPFTPCWI